MGGEVRLAAVPGAMESDVYLLQQLRLPLNDGRTNSRTR